MLGLLAGAPHGFLVLEPADTGGVLGAVENNRTVLFNSVWSKCPHSRRDATITSKDTCMLPILWGVNVSS